jgi:hypothetical protein
MRISRSQHFIRAIWTKTQIIYDVCKFFEMTEDDLIILMSTLYMPKEFIVDDMYRFLKKAETDKTYNSKEKLRDLLNDLFKRGFITFIGRKHEGNTYIINKDKIKYFVDVFNSFVTRDQRWLAWREFRPEHKWASKGYNDVKLYLKRQKYAEDKKKKNAVV